MITLRKFNTAAKLLLILVPAIFVSGCTTVSHTSNTTSKTAALVQAEPGPDRLVRYCRRMAETNNLRIAIGVCQRALEAAPENPEPVLILAEAYVDAKRHKEASEAYRFALLIDGANGDAHFGLGKLYLRESKLEEAKPHLEAALVSGKEDPAVFNAMGILLDQLGQHGEAQKLYHMGLGIQPENTALANNLGVSLLLSERLDEGVSVLGNLQPNSRPNLIRRSNLETAQAVASASHIAHSTAAAHQHPIVDGGSDTSSTALAPVADVSTMNVEPHLVTSSAQPTPRLAQLKPKSALAPKITISSPQITPAPKSTFVTIQPILDSIGDSSVVAAEDLAPVVSPAPIVVVDFQTLPTLPVEQTIADLPDSNRNFTAHSDQNQLPETTDFAGTPPNTTENLRTVPAPAPNTAAVAVRNTVIKPQPLKDLVDLAQVTPRRKPVPAVDIELDFADLATQTPSYRENRTVTLSDITHLPVEEPGVDRRPADGVIQLNPPEGHHSGYSSKDSLSQSEPRLFVAKAPASRLANDQISGLVEAWALSTASSVLLESTSTPDEIVSDAIRPAPSEPQIVRRHEGQSGGLNIDARDVDTDAEAEDDSKPLKPRLTGGFLASLPSQAEQTHAVGGHDDQPPTDSAPIDWPGFLVDHINQSQFPIPQEPYDQNSLALMLLSREFFATG